MLLVIHAVISEDLSLRRISGRDSSPAMDDAVRLIKIHGLGDVVGDDGIVLPHFGNAIYLHRQQNRHAFPPQVARQQHRRGCSPTVAEENNASPRFFLGGKNAVVIRVQQVDDSIVGLFPVPIFKNPNVGGFWNSSPDLLREFDRAMVRIVMAYETTYETDYDVGRSRSRFGRKRRGLDGSREPRNTRTQNRKTDKRSAN